VEQLFVLLGAVHTGTRFAYYRSLLSVVEQYPVMYSRNSLASHPKHDKLLIEINYAGRLAGRLGQSIETYMNA
jgi:hypothetical protein